MMERVSEMEWDIKYKIYLNAWDLSDHTLVRFLRRCGESLRFLISVDWYTGG